MMNQVSRLKMYCFLFYGFIFSLAIFSKQKTPKIVGLIQVKNEEIFLENCLHAISLYTDAIVILDDCSTDKTLNIIEKMSLQCNIEKIIKKTEWIYDEISVRRELLSAGRSIAGTHFIIIDADEMFSANCLDQNYLRREILALNPGEALSLPLVNLWKSIHFYAPSLVSNIHTIFCDDGSVNYKKPEKSLSIKIHIPRIPSDYFKIKYLSEPNCILVHFRFTNWRDSIIKKIWYMCFELINNDLDKSNFEISEMINNRYGKTFFNDSELDKTILCTNPLWFTYSFFDSAIALKDTQEWRKSCILHWFNTYGKDYFKNLAIWELDIYNI